MNQERGREWTGHHPLLGYRELVRCMYHTWTVLSRFKGPEANMLRHFKECCKHVALFFFKYIYHFAALLAIICLFLHQLRLQFRIDDLEYRINKELKLEETRFKIGFIRSTISLFIPAYIKSVLDIGFEAIMYIFVSRN